MQLDTLSAIERIDDRFEGDLAAAVVAQFLVMLGESEADRFAHRSTLAQGKLEMVLGPADASWLALEVKPTAGQPGLGVGGPERPQIEKPAYEPFIQV